MKATGIVRRIDDLGRVVIPKEIRRTMRIREGDPLDNVGYALEDLDGDGKAELLISAVSKEASGGMLYQWGRPSPFPYAKNYTNEAWGTRLGQSAENTPAYHYPSADLITVGGTGGAGGGIAGLYLMTQRVTASNYKFGQCTIVPIQYMIEDFAGYVDMCNKDGYPVRKTLNLHTDNVTGYVQCSGAYVDYCPGATEANLSTINSYLNSGIVIEE